MEELEYRRVKWLDRIGQWMSGLCIVHCILVPLLFLVFPVIGHSLVEKGGWFHEVLFVSISAIAGLSIYLGYRIHFSWQPVIWLSTGVLFIACGIFVFPASGLTELLFTVGGGLCLIRGHLLNHSLRHLDKACTGCAKDHH